MYRPSPLSLDTLAQLQQLYESQSTYQPDEAIAAQLAHKHVLLFVGPTCAGKNTVMETVAKTDGSFTAVGRFTSREPRSDDKDYTYYDNTDEGLAPILGAISRRHVVQYAVHPYAYTLYGSNLEDYPGKYNMIDVFSGAVEQFKQLGFRQAVVLSIVTDPTAWRKRFDERFPIGHSQRGPRRDEAIESLTWSLAQHAKDRHWIENVDGEPEITAQRVIAITTSVSDGEKQLDALARATLRAIREIKV
jgi:hypothetical protein